MALDWEIEVYRDGKRSENLKVAQYEYNKADPNYSLRRVSLATCPGRYCNCPNCRRMREDAMTNAPLGHAVHKSKAGYVAVIFAGHKQIRVVALFPTLMDALAYVKANYKTEPMGKTKFVTRSGEVLMIQAGVRIITVEAT